MIPPTTTTIPSSASSDSRERILEAAARIYAQYGFRGATTRLIAQEAGVNEVTLFRLFGSKAQLFDELLHKQLHASTVPLLPEEPLDPERELTEWCTALFAQMRASRSFLRKMIGETEERPEAARSACVAPHCAAESLDRYVQSLRARGLADETADHRTAICMFMSTLFGDVMVRDAMEDHYFPEPADDAPARYIATFLRAAGVPASPAVPRNLDGRDAR
jgi:AcrR family transcriptional regulator